MIFLLFPCFALMDFPKIMLNMHNNIIKLNKNIIFLLTFFILKYFSPIRYILFAYKLIYVDLPCHFVNKTRCDCRIAKITLQYINLWHQIKIKYFSTQTFWKSAYVNQKNRDDIALNICTSLLNPVSDVSIYFNKIIIYFMPNQTFF